MVVPFFIPSSSELGFLLFHILTSNWPIIIVLDCRRCNSCVVVSCFHLHFPDAVYCRASFHMVICCLYVSLWWGISWTRTYFFQLGCLFSYYWVLRVLCIFKHSLINLPGCPGSSLLCACFLWLCQVGATLGGSPQVLPCSGFSCCGAQTLSSWASVAAALGL